MASTPVNGAKDPLPCVLSLPGAQGWRPHLAGMQQYVGMTEGGLYFSRGTRKGFELNFLGRREGGWIFFLERGLKFPTPSR